MTEIKFRLVDGEPVCDPACKKYESRGLTSLSGYYDQRNYCAAAKEHVEVFDGDPCIPGLRQQRDDRERERDEARAELQPAISERNELRGLIEVYMTDLAEARAVIGRVREEVDFTLARPVGEFSVFTSPKDFARKLRALLPAPATEDAASLDTLTRVDLEQMIATITDIPLTPEQAERCAWFDKLLDGMLPTADDFNVMLRSSKTAPATDKPSTGPLPPTSLKDVKMEKTREEIKSGLRRHGLIKSTTEEN